MARFLPILAFLVSFFPFETSALVRQTIDTDSLFDEAFQNCRNDPVNSYDPLGLAGEWSEMVQNKVDADEQWWNAHTANNTAAQFGTATLMTIEKSTGVLLSLADNFADQVGSFFGEVSANDYHKEHIPIAGPAGARLGENYAKYLDNPTFENYLKVIASWSECAGLPGGVVLLTRGAGMTGSNKSGSSTTPHQPSVPRQEFQNLMPEHPVGVPKIVSPQQLKTISNKLNYVVTKEGKLVLGRIDDMALGGGHIDLAGGRPVLAAGEVVIVKGKVIKLNNKSGHYMPKGASAKAAAEKAFADAGLDATGKYKEVY